MGGQGSGDWYRLNSKATTERQDRIDMRFLKKQGCLRPGYMGSLSWSCGGKETGSINYRMEANRMILNYRHRPRNGEWEPVEQVISFDRTPCNYGGYRLWFRCPHCYRRVAILYGAGKYFFCRHCYNLTYSSQQESRMDRLMRKARKIRKRIGASNDLFMPILFKPKHMHQKTFARLRIEADCANYHSSVLMLRKLDALKMKVEVKV